jgi:hypothetical protein
MIFAESLTGNGSILKNQVTCKILPNPFTESIWIETPLTFKSIEVYNSVGQSVYKENGLYTTIDLSAIPSGIYVIRIRTDKQVFQQKIVKN